MGAVRLGFKEIGKIDVLSNNIDTEVSDPVANLDTAIGTNIYLSTCVDP